MKINKKTIYDNVVLTSEEAKTFIDIYDLIVDIMNNASNYYYYEFEDIADDIYEQITKFRASKGTQTSVRIELKEYSKD